MELLFEELEAERAEADELQRTLDEEERVLRTEDNIVDDYSRVCIHLCRSSILIRSTQVLVAVSGHESITEPHLQNCELDLEAVVPVLDDAKNSLTSLRKSEIAEVR